MPQKESPRIGWIGLGKMGVPMCKRLKDAGYVVTTYARNSPGRERADALGIAHVGDWASLAEASDILFSAIPYDKALNEIIAGERGLATAMRANQALVETSTVSPEASSEVGELLEARGATYLRCPVSGSVQQMMKDQGPRHRAFCCAIA